MKKTYLLPALLAFVPLAACGSEESSDAAVKSPAEITLAEAMESSSDVSGLVAAIREAGLGDIFSAPGGYTIIAPPNAVFAQLTQDGNEAVPPAVLAAMLREHMLPGQLDLASIRKAIAENDGKVSVNTMGSGMIDFTLDGEDVIAAHQDSGLKAKLTGSIVEANNGALLLADAALAAPPKKAE
ncbi:fasciclin domain-containing protein [Erythrobacter sp. SDW2]|uniref:fasciclin domain-containing protein n=1 Tax=Erythrobacter sp. SDW2 TaxID=2907154 RepID=UPI001F1ABF30|nr:fasciclin domain-containing protein [Erythrobacter sp. SDW2]UIP06516.1 fasciclin domain-containing protein [Erythrobacter sp. SDW2]